MQPCNLWTKSKDMARCLSFHARYQPISTDGLSALPWAQQVDEYWRVHSLLRWTASWKHRFPTNDVAAKGWWVIQLILLSGNFGKYGVDLPLRFESCPTRLVSRISNHDWLQHTMAMDCEAMLSASSNFKSQLGEKKSGRNHVNKNWVIWLVKSAHVTRDSNYHSKYTNGYNSGVKNYSWV